MARKSARISSETRDRALMVDFLRGKRALRLRHGQHGHPVKYMSEADFIAAADGLIGDGLAVWGPGWDHYEQLLPTLALAA